MREKQSAALFLAAVSSVVVYSEAHAEETVHYSESMVDPQFGDITIAPEMKASLYTSEDLQVVTNLKDLQNMMYNEMKNFSDTLKVQYKGDTKELNEQFKQIFAQAKENEDYLLGVVIGYGYSLDGYVNDATVTIQFKYTTDAQKEAYTIAEVKRLLSEMIQPSMSEVEKVQAINEYIVKNTTYSKNSTASPHAAYTILTEGKGVCQAYAMLAYMMLKEAGLEAHYVTGFAGEDHAWNLVKVDGEWYHLDPTWNDPTYSNPQPEYADYISYDYFLISDNEIFQDHKMDDRPELPAANSEKFRILRDDLSMIFTGTSANFVSTPENHQGKLYFINYQDGSYNINKINLLSNNPTNEHFADVRAVDILTTNNGIYFIDAGNNYGLSKVDYETKAVTKAHTTDKITSMKKDSNKLYAYSNSKLVYSVDNEDSKTIEPEPIMPPAEVKVIDDMSTQISYLNKEFAVRAEQLFTYLKNVDDSVKQFLSNDTVAKVNEIEAKYNKMKNLTFANSDTWKKEAKTAIPRKSWTIALSQDVKNTAENKKYIRVVDMFGDPVNVSINIEGAKITVTPTADYVEEIPYTLVIGAGIENANGDKLPKGTHMKFYFK